MASRAGASTRKRHHLEWAGQVSAIFCPATDAHEFAVKRFVSPLSARLPAQTPMDGSRIPEASRQSAGLRHDGQANASAQRFWGWNPRARTAPLKQFTFDKNVQGNLASPTIDTHNIRGSIYQFDQLHPGELHPDWFSSPEAYAAYRANGGFTPEALIGRSAIDDSLARSVTRAGGKNRSSTAR